MTLIPNKSGKKALLRDTNLYHLVWSLHCEIPNTIGRPNHYVYAPNAADPDAFVKDYYDKLHQAINNIPTSGILILRDDISAKVGTDTQNWDSVIDIFVFPYRLNCSTRLFWGQNLGNHATTKLRIYSY